MSTIVRLACPNCRHNLAEENLHSNILQCPRCNSYTYYESQMFNPNVFFGLLRCQTYQLDKLRSTIIDKYVEQASLRAIRNLRFLHAERLLVPMRDISENGSPRMVPLLAENLEAANENADVRKLLEGVSDVSKLFPLQYLHPFRLGDVREEIDSSGYITRTTVLPVGRTKSSIDTAYNLRPDGLLRILYLPIYRLSFSDKGQKLLCFANEDLTGLTYRSNKQKTGLDLDFEEYVHVALLFAVILTIIADIVAIFFGFYPVSPDSGFLLNALVIIVFYIVLSAILVLVFTSVLSVGMLFFSKLSVSLNVIASAKKWLIRRMLTRRFRLNEKRR